MFSSRFSLSPIRLVECPRDAMQGLSLFIPTAQKIQYLNALLKCGFYAVDCASFVSPRAVPQMRDSAEVLAGCDQSLLFNNNYNSASKLSVVVASLAGFRRALETPQVSIIGFPLACSEKFQQRNTRKSIAEALTEVTEMQANLVKFNSELTNNNNNNSGVNFKKEFVVYLSMAFGNPYGESHNAASIEKLTSELFSIGIRTISLADTIGASHPALIFDTFTQLQRRFPEIIFGAHLHSSTPAAKEKVIAAIEAGCKIIDSALGGMGGCPFAKDDGLTGNVATEVVVQALREKQYVPTSLNIKQLEACVQLKQDIFGVSVKDMMLSQSLRDEKRFAELCQEHFRLYDVENKGTLTYEGFRSSMLQVFSELGGEAPSEEKIRSSFHKVDIQKLGCITLDAYTMGARRLLMKRINAITNPEINLNNNDSHNSKRTISA